MPKGYAIAPPMSAEELESWLKNYQPVPWTEPTSLLGEVALQLRDLDAAARILTHHPSFLEHLVSQHSSIETARAFRIGEKRPEASKLIASHRAWCQTMSSLLARSSELIDPEAFQAARSAYEEEMFCAARETAPARR